MTSIMTITVTAEVPPVVIVLYVIIGPTNPAVPIPEPIALFVIFKTTVEIGPRMALVMIGGSQINGFLTILGTCNIDVPIPCANRPPIPFSRKLAVAKPIICAANGTAVAGGLEIALACDIIVASENARFGLSEVKVGFLATSGGLIRLPNIIPKKIASEMVLTGKLIDAQRAYEVGLVNYVVPREQVMDKAMELAEIIAANAPISLKLSKEIFHVATQCSFEDAQRYCNRCWDYIEKTEDAVEGPKAFLEKRKPDWKGR